MKNSLLLFGLIIGLLLSTYSLDGQVGFETVDSIALNLDESFDNPKDLALKLTTSLESDLDKARVIYMWIVKNIRYDCRKFHNNKPIRFEARSKEAAARKMLEWREQQVKKTIKYRKGICEDYSRLYKALCDEAGVEAVVVSGDARDFYKPYQKKQDNPHAWNAVKISDEWFLLDATWGAGYTNAEVTKFSRRIGTGYFQTPASLFAQNHFPDDEKWQLLDKPISRKEFVNQPIINYGQTKYRIKDFSLAVKSVPGSQKRKEIWLEFEKTPKIITITNKKKKRVEFKRTDKNGKVFLSFSNSVSRQITIYGGKSNRSRKDWFARYEL